MNNKTYVGQHKTSNIGDSYMGSGTILHQAFERYGMKNFSKSILAITEKKEIADILEKYFIALFREEGKAEYNIADGGQIRFSGAFEIERRLKISISSKGKIHSEETKKKIGKNNKGKKHPHSEETKKKIGKASSERWNDDSYKKFVGKKISESRRGKKMNKPAWNKGKQTGCHWWNNGVDSVLSKECPEGFVPGRIFSEKVLNIMKNCNVGRTHIVSEETKKKMSESQKKNPNKSMFGRKHSEETKKKMSEKAKGRVVKLETKEKLKSYMTGKKLIEIDGKKTWQ